MSFKRILAGIVFGAMRVGTHKGLRSVFFGLKVSRHVALATARMGALFLLPTEIAAICGLTIDSLRGVVLVGYSCPALLLSSFLHCDVFIIVAFVEVFISVYIVELPLFSHDCFAQGMCFGVRRARR